MNIPGATQVDQPGGAPIDQTPPDTPRGVSHMSSLVNTLPPDLLDRARIRARETTYPNGQAEQEMVDAVDRAAWDRVQAVERQLMSASQIHIERSRARIKEADALSERIDALTRRAERGEVSPEVAAEYKALMAQASQLVGRLSVAEREAEAWRGKLADPYAHTQRILSLMPFSSGVRLDPRPYLNR